MPDLFEGLSEDEAEAVLSLWMARNGDFNEFFRHCTIETHDGLVRTDPRWDYFQDPQYSPQHISFDDAVDQGLNVVVLKTRQMGATTRMRGKDYFDAHFTTPIPLLLISQGERESQEYLKLIGTMHAHMPPEMGIETDRKPTQEVFSLKGGGRLYSLPSTSKAGRSLVSYRTTFDENAFHDDAQAAYTAVEAQARQIVQISTANGENFFADKFWTVWKGEGADNEVAFFFPWHVRPDRQNPDGTPNTEWYAQKRAKYKGFEEDFLAEYPSNPEEAFLARSGLVYADEWSESQNVLAYDPFSWDDAQFRVAGVDFGGGDPTAAVTLGRNRAGHIHQFEEFYDTEGTATLPQLVEWLAERQVQYVFCDPSSAISIQTMRAAGINALGKTTGGKSLNDRAYGITTVGTLLKTGQLTIHSLCDESIHEFTGYRWRNRRDPNTRQDYATSTPVDNHADAMDARRYAIVGLMGLTGQIQAPVRPGTLSGKPLATKAV